MNQHLTYQRRIESLRAKRRLAKDRLAMEETALILAQTKVTQTSEAQHIVQTVAEEVQRHAHSQIAGIVTRCLEGVFGDDAYQFEIQFDRKRGKTEAKFVFLREGKEIDPIDAAGGGVVDVAAFALRLAALMLVRPQPRKLLVLDESFRFLSAKYRPAVRVLLEQLAKDLGVQIIMVTHSAELVIGNILEIE